MADKKVTQLTALTAPANTDLLLVIDDPAGSPISKKITIEDLFGKTSGLSVTTINLTSTADTTLAANNFTIDKLTKHIKDIIHSKTYSIDNFNRLIKQNEELENDNRILKEKNKSQEIIIIEKNIQINEFREKIENQQKVIETVKFENQPIYLFYIYFIDFLYKTTIFPTNLT